ncbi:hypothetical protein NDU88_007016 [Pleurodeles waltl]|uniref:Uncharacterized protein n=1 Tax=Pleurodeles waltl TaxID=8319 RepID=A0AAV7PKE8_PLEWA|nr:hypothetical protein NDU88_007016 [Pleurodeles waltl]
MPIRAASCPQTPPGSWGKPTPSHGCLALIRAAGRASPPRRGYWAAPSMCQCVAKEVAVLLHPVLTGTRMCSADCS